MFYLLYLLTYLLRLGLWLWLALVFGWQSLIDVCQINVDNRHLFIWCTLMK